MEVLVAETLCLAPGNVHGGIVSVGGLTVGSTVTYKAQNKYRHVGGDLVRTCRVDQLWTRVEPVFRGIAISLSPSLSLPISISFFLSFSVLIR